MGMFGLDHNHANSFFCGLTQQPLLSTAAVLLYIMKSAEHYNLKKNKGLLFILFWVKEQQFYFKR